MSALKQTFIPQGLRLQFLHPPLTVASGKIFLDDIDRNESKVGQRVDSKKLKRVLT